MIRLEKLVSYKHPSLLRKSLNYGQKSFIILSPGSNVIKLFTTVSYNFRNKLERLYVASLSSLV